MNTIAPSLVAASAAILLLLGLAHLLFTFRGPKLRPRDRELQTRMQEVSPVITRQTTMWKAWIGFNASHSYGLILFGAMYGYLALAHHEFLFQSVFLLSLGLRRAARLPVPRQNVFLPHSASGRHPGDRSLCLRDHRQPDLIQRARTTAGRGRACAPA